MRDRSDLGHDLDVDTRTTLLDVLREHLHLTGTKKGESISMLFLLNRSFRCGVARRIEQGREERGEHETQSRGDEAPPSRDRKRE